MRLTVLGCSGTVESALSPCSGYLVEADGYRLLLDAGNGVLSSLQRYADLVGVDAIVISHLHGDHWLDLVPYTYAMHYCPGADGRRTKLLAPTETLRVIGSVMPECSEEFVAETYEFSALGEADVEVGPFAIAARGARHPVEAYSLRIEHDGRSLVYSGDTGEADALDTLARNADVFLCEAGFAGQSGEFPEGVHLTGEQAGGHAARAGVDRLVLTHLMPWADRGKAVREARRLYPGSLFVAERGLMVDV